jgi:hypothetical protein
MVVVLAVVTRGRRRGGGFLRYGVSAEAKNQRGDGDNCLDYDRLLFC